MAGEEFLFVGMPTLDLFSIAPTVVNLQYAARLLNKNFALMLTEGFGVTAGRHDVLRQIREILPDEERAKILWVDHDILVVDNPQRVADVIRKADELGYNFVANYKHKLMSNLVYKDIGVPYTDDELDKAEDFELVVKVGAFGFSYLDTPLNYLFHTKADETEDVNFFKENFDNSDKVRFVNIKLKHSKRMLL